MLEAKPLTDEQLWGVPQHLLPAASAESQEPVWCLHKKQRCMWWDHGCQLEICFVGIEQ